MRCTGSLLRCGWATVVRFGRTDARLGVELGATAVLHTHSRTRDYHPHVHLLVPAGVVDPRTRLWRSKGRGPLRVDRRIETRTRSTTETFCGANRQRSAPMWSCGNR